MSDVRSSRGLLGLLPGAPDRRVRAMAWASLVAEVLLVTTGGLVRLTDSGLGCPTWPDCTAGHLRPVAATGWHGLVEFGNRTLTGLLVAVAVLAFLAVVRMWWSRRDLVVLALIQLLSIPAQAVLGGITVLTKLNPWMVGAHFVFSLVLVSLMAVFVVRSSRPAGPRRRAVPVPFLVLTHVATLALAVTLLLGVLTTGAGPHAGDAHSIRNGFDPVVLQSVHEIPAFVLAGVVLILLVWSVALRVARGPLVLLASVLAAQIAVGLWQAADGLPIGLVDIHQSLAAVLTASAVWLVLSLKRPAAIVEPSAARHDDLAAAR